MPCYYKSISSFYDDIAKHQIFNIRAQYRIIISMYWESPIYTFYIIIPYAHYGIIYIQHAII